LRFSDRGDSGAAVLNGAGKIVGLLFGHDAADTTKSYASHIHPVLATLKVTGITQAHPLHGNKASVESRADMPLVISGRPNQVFHLRERFIASAQGRRLLELVEQHRPEVVHLVNNNRRVTVAWHRNKGPAFLNRAMNNARDAEEMIPKAIEGVTRRDLLGRMGDALAEHGSLLLRTAVLQHREAVLDFAEECDSLHELVDRLAERQLV
jgi:hypothetical protein